MALQSILGVISIIERIVRLGYTIKEEQGRQHRRATLQDEREAQWTLERLKKAINNKAAKPRR